MKEQEEVSLVWHRMEIECVACTKVMDMKSFFFSADGEIRLGLKCPQCGKETYITTNGACLVRQATLNDIAILAAKEKSQSPKPRSRKKKVEVSQRPTQLKTRDGWLN
jgi:hypothetical protein